jgi:hypothetical protein
MNNITNNSDADIDTIASFCARIKISRTTYYKLRKAGRGPREMRANDVVRISPQARQDWMRELEQTAAA